MFLQLAGVSLFSRSASASASTSSSGERLQGLAAQAQLNSNPNSAQFWRNNRVSYCEPPTHLLKISVSTECRISPVCSLHTVTRIAEGQWMSSLFSLLGNVESARSLVRTATPPPSQLPTRGRGKTHFKFCNLTNSHIFPIAGTALLHNFPYCLCSTL